jgi:hypothetical protein
VNVVAAKVQDRRVADLAFIAPGVYEDIDALGPRPPVEMFADVVRAVETAIASMAAQFYNPANDVAFPVEFIVHDVELGLAAGRPRDGLPPPPAGDEGWAVLCEETAGGAWDYGWLAVHGLKRVPWDVRARAYVAIARAALTTAGGGGGGGGGAGAGGDGGAARGAVHMCRAWAALVRAWKDATAGNGQERQAFVSSVVRLAHDAARLKASLGSMPLPGPGAAPPAVLRVLDRRARAIQELGDLQTELSQISVVGGLGGP